MSPRLLALAAGGAAALLLAACGYPDPTKAGGPVASTSTCGAEFNAGAGQAPVTFPDGLQIIDLKPGTGATVQSGYTIKVQYTGWLSDGTKFDSSCDRGQPFEVTIGAGQVIPGWDEGIPGMKVGGERKLTIPPALGYGSQGAGQTIPPNSTLVFVVDVVSITSTAPPPSPSPSPSP